VIVVVVEVVVEVEEEVTTRLLWGGGEGETSLEVAGLLRAFGEGVESFEGVEW
jgi:hypothetical protein